MGVVDWLSLFEVGCIIIYGGVVSLGEYQFSEVVDLMGVYVFCFSVDISVMEYLSEFWLMDWFKLILFKSMIGDIDDVLWGVMLMM